MLEFPDVAFSEWVLFLKTILIVDDSAFMRSLIKRNISDLDLEVVGEADDGEVAVKKYIELSPDIVTLDLAMVDHDGVEALKKIMNHDPKAKVIVVSSITDQEAMVNVVTALGARAVLNKPIVKDALVKAIEAVLAE